MASKDQVRRLMAKGLTWQQITTKLKCSGGYVRETMARIRDPNREAKQQRDYRQRRADRTNAGATATVA